MVCTIMLFVFCAHFWNALMGLKTGFAAGIVGTLLGFPLDLVKTRQVYN